MRLFALSVFAFFIALTTTAQVAGASQHLKQQAQTMVASLLNGDYKTFTAFTYPPLVQSVGGAAKMENILSQSMAGLKTQGVSFSKISFDDPSKIVSSGTQLQATIAQHTEMKMTDGRLVNTSTLIAISSDNGLHWTFIDTSNKDMAALRRVLPNLNLNPAIIIPAPSPPVRLGN